MRTLEAIVQILNWNTYVICIMYTYLKHIFFLPAIARTKYNMHIKSGEIFRRKNRRRVGIAGWLHQSEHTQIRNNFRTTPSCRKNKHIVITLSTAIILTPALLQVVECNRIDPISAHRRPAAAALQYPPGIYFILYLHNETPRYNNTHFVELFESAEFTMYRWVADWGRRLSCNILYYLYRPIAHRLTAVSGTVSKNRRSSYNIHRSLFFLINRHKSIAISVQ